MNINLLQRFRDGCLAAFGGRRLAATISN